MKYLTILLISFTTIPVIGQTEQKISFKGLYTGINIGIQNLYGGSFVNDTDMLSRDSRFVAEIPLGYRWQLFKSQLMVGIEVHIGFTDGNLSLNDPPNSINIRYENGFQSGKGINIGWQLDNWMVYSYLNETKRKFDVTIHQEEYRYTQTDKQGILRYGLGIRRIVSDLINVGVSVGKTHSDFGDLDTNIDVNGHYDYSVGLAFQF